MLSEEARYHYSPSRVEFWLLQNAMLSILYYEKHHGQGPILPLFEANMDTYSYRNSSRLKYYTNHSMSHVCSMATLCKPTCICGLPIFHLKNTSNKLLHVKHNHLQIEIPEVVERYGQNALLFFVHRPSLGILAISNRMPLPLLPDSFAPSSASFLLSLCPSSQMPWH